MWHNITYFIDFGYRFIYCSPGDFQSSYKSVLIGFIFPIAGWHRTRTGWRFSFQLLAYQTQAPDAGSASIRWLTPDKHRMQGQLLLTPYKHLMEVQISIAAYSTRAPDAVQLLLYIFKRRIDIIMMESTNETWFIWNAKKHCIHEWIVYW